MNPEQILLTSGEDDKVINVMLDIKCGHNVYFSSSQEREKVIAVGSQKASEMTMRNNEIIIVNSVYSPIIKAHFVVEEGINKFKENIVFTIITSGALTPFEAMGQACEILAAYSNLFGSVSRIGLSRKAGLVLPFGTEVEGVVDNSHVSTEKSKIELIKEDIYHNVDGTPKIGSQGIELIKNLPIKAYDTLKNNNINTIFELEELINPQSGVYTSANGNTRSEELMTLVNELRSFNFEVYENE